MKRWEAIAAGGGLLLLASALFLSPRTHHRVSEGVLETGNCRAHFTEYEHVPATQTGTAIIFHGLAANRKLMTPVANWMMGAHLRKAFTVDMPGHGDSAEAFSFERAEQCAAEFVGALIERGDVELERLAIIGHSTGGGIAIRLADRYDAGVTIAISPAPLTSVPGPWDSATPYRLPQRLPGNLLVFIASLDPFPIRRSAAAWIAGAGGNDDSDPAFRERRALRLSDVPRATHTSLLVDVAVGRESANWVRRALDGGGVKMAPSAPVGYILALLGVTLMFPAAATLTARAAGASRSAGAIATSAPASRMIYFVWFAASLAAAIALKFWIPLRSLRLFSGDYFASFLLIVGVLGMVALWKIAHTEAETGQTGRPLAGVLVMATALGFVALLAGSAILDWQSTDVWMNAARWMRFPFLLPAMLPYAVAEEWALGVPLAGKGAAWRRVFRALALRALIWAMMLLAFLVLRSNQVLIPLLAAYLALFSIAQRLGADAIRRRTGSTAAAAVFSAILAGWYIAAVFPLL
ncbi:MAG: alpha/beta hydrolase [Candidatus Acidiferrales bacterium]